MAVASEWIRSCFNAEGVPPLGIYVYLFLVAKSRWDYQLCSFIWPAVGALRLVLLPTQRNPSWQTNKWKAAVGGRSEITSQGVKNNSFKTNKQPIWNSIAIKNTYIWSLQFIKTSTLTLLTLLHSSIITTWLWPWSAQLEAAQSPCRLRWSSPPLWVCFLGCPGQWWLWRGAADPRHCWPGWWAGRSTGCPAPGQWSASESASHPLPQTGPFHTGSRQRVHHSLSIIYTLHTT